MTTISGRHAKSGNNAVLLLDSKADVIEFQADPAQVGAMKHVLPLLLVIMLAWPAAAQAACYADYKAKQDAPLRLHYGVAEISGPCDVRSATQQLQSRLQNAGWTLLNVVSVFDENGLAERKESAGPHFLRY
jgi:hypothetical protein